MIIDVGFDITLTTTTPNALIFVLNVHPERAHDVLEGDQVTVDPPHLERTEYLDAFGNRCGRIALPGPGQVTVTLSNRAVVRDSGLPDELAPDAPEIPPHRLPPQTVQFLLPSRYCEVDSPLMQLAWSTFGHVTPGWARVQAICDYVHDHLKFDYGLARPTRTALQAHAEQLAVCRDFAHLAITLCRAMNIPARYATGYMGDIRIPIVPGPMDFSAWFEVWLGERWYTFDARHNFRRIGRIVMARGRDAGDVPLTMTFGQHWLNRFDVYTTERGAVPVPPGTPMPSRTQSPPPQAQPAVQPTVAPPPVALE